jgi:hypothetical protein
MNRRAAFVMLSLVLVSLILGGCRGAEAEQSTSVPTPGMPADWQAVNDYLVTPQQLAGLASRMSARLLGVRNTFYTVGGRRVQLNTIIAASPPDAERVMAYMLTIKSEDALLRRGTTVYEFVGPNEVTDLIRAGRQHLNR